jgi:hypothetical protein
MSPFAALVYCLAINIMNERQTSGSAPKEKTVSRDNYGARADGVLGDHTEKCAVRITD